GPGGAGLRPVVPGRRLRRLNPASPTTASPGARSARPGGRCFSMGRRPEDFSMTCAEQNQVHLRLESLESRATPGFLTVTPRAGFIDPLTNLAVPHDAQPGLHSAQVHTGGAITWFIDPLTDL